MNVISYLIELTFQILTFKLHNSYYYLVLEALFKKLNLKYLIGSNQLIIKQHISNFLNIIYVF